MNISNVGLANFVRRNGIVFTTGYFQALTGQPIRKIERESVSLEEFKLICDGDQDMMKEKILFLLLEIKKEH